MLRLVALQGSLTETVERHPLKLFATVFQPELPVDQVTLGKLLELSTYGRT